MEYSILEKIRLIKEKARSIQHKGKEWKHCGKWIRSGVITYIDPAGKEKTYETVERTTRPEITGVDGVDVITLMTPPTSESGCNNRKICLVLVYRPPIDRYSLELPSGLVDPGESLQQAAERELLEETGYTCKIKSVGPVVFTDPWKSNENSAVCVAEVTASRNRPALKLDEDEYLEPIELPLKGLKKLLELLQNDHGFVIEARLYFFAVGLEMQSQVY